MESERSNKNKNMKSSNYVTLLFWILGVVVLGLIINSAIETQQPQLRDQLIAGALLLVFMWIVSAVVLIMDLLCKDNYDVNKDTEKGQENTAFDAENSRKNGGENSQQPNGSSSQQSGSGDEKWVSNYVPFGDYPKGNIVYVKEDGPN